jgi:hypothetical protein
MSHRSFRGLLRCPAYGFWGSECTQMAPALGGNPGCCRSSTGSNQAVALHGDGRTVRLPRLGSVPWGIASWVLAMTEEPP